MKHGIEVKTGMEDYTPEQMSHLGHFGMKPTLLAGRPRGASGAAKRRNPRLKRVKG